MIKRLRLFEEASEEDFHIYVDEITGSYYYFDGTSLIKLGDKPRVGDKGNQDIQNAEEEKRKEDRQKEKDEGDDTPDETEEERQERIKKISDLLDSGELKQKIDDTNKGRVKPATAAERQAAKKEAAVWGDVDLPKNGIEDFKLTLNKFIKRELSDQKTKEYTYSRINKNYARSGIIKPGTRKVENKKIPSIAVYFDQSASWNSSDIEKGMEALKALDKYVKEKRVKLNLFYFGAGAPQSTPNVNRSGTNCPAVVEHINRIKPDNVIIMTDADGDSYGNSAYTLATVPGAVWWLWKKGWYSRKFRDHVIGRKENKQFII